jgi:hypothetical protein
MLYSSPALHDQNIVSPKRHRAGRLRALVLHPQSRHSRFTQSSSQARKLNLFRVNSAQKKTKKILAMMLLRSLSMREN